MRQGSGPTARYSDAERRNNSERGKFFVFKEDAGCKGGENHTKRASKNAP